MAQSRRSVPKHVQRSVRKRDRGLCGVHLGGCSQPVRAPVHMGHVVPVNASRSGYNEAVLAETGYSTPLGQPALPERLAPPLAKRVWGLLEQLPENLQPMCPACDQRMQGTYLNSRDILSRFHVPVDPAIRWPIHELRWRWDDEWRAGALARIGHRFPISSRSSCE